MTDTTIPPPPSPYSTLYTKHINRVEDLATAAATVNIVHMRVVCVCVCVVGTVEVK